MDVDDREQCAPEKVILLLLFTVRHLTKVMYLGRRDHILLGQVVLPDWGRRKTAS